jgi:hypothetical protein
VPRCRASVLRGKNQGSRLPTLDTLRTAPAAACVLPGCFWFHLHLRLPRGRLPVLATETNMGALLSSPEGAASAPVTDSHLRPAHHEPQPCQAPAADHDADDMDPAERAYHERFMREAINMVRHRPRQPVFAFVPGPANLWSTTGRTCTQERRDPRRLCLCQGWRRLWSWHERDEPHPQRHETCRVCCAGRHPVQASNQRPARDRSLRDRRALCHVRLDASPVWHSRRLLWMLEREVRRHWRRAQHSL